ncbi:MAG: hypothetical protein KJO69_01305 [Gammaproteobacteria bacterium]|nr:hypothetical protein [Gammaproteobacteria bacterium]NNJ71861.1 hypothetical protein [Enterobacterales bacterium]
MKYIYWFSGFVVLFVFNVIVEAFVLPAIGLDNTPKNDIYFQIWWLVVITWLFFGLPIINKKLPKKQDSKPVEMP